MAEKKKDDKNTVEERVEEVLSDALAEELGEIPEVSITAEELRRLEKASRKKKHSKLTKFVSVAAVAVVVCAAVVYLAWPESMVPVDADKNTEQRVEEGDGEIIINEGDVEGESGIVTRTETEWKNLKKQRDFVPSLGIPSYIPDQYSFKELQIEKSTDGDFCARYLFVNTNNNIILRIEQQYYAESGINTKALIGDAKRLNTDFGDVYIIPNEDENSIAIKFTDDNSFKVISNLNEDEQIKVLKNIKIP